MKGSLVGIGAWMIKKADLTELHLQFIALRVRNRNRGEKLNRATLDRGRAEEKLRWLGAHMSHPVSQNPDF